MTPITPIPATFEDFVYYTNNLIKERERVVVFNATFNNISVISYFNFNNIFFYPKKKKD